MAIRSSPVVLDLQQKVTYAQRYWTARHPQDHIMKRVTGVRIEAPRATSIIPTSMINWNIPQPKAIEQQKSSDPMEELAKKFAEMTAHLGNIVKEIKGRDCHPIQKFAATTEKKRGTCYSCREEGHYSYECMSETKCKA